MQNKIVFFGDYLMHLSPGGNERFIQANTLNLSFTGAEANVCAALSFWGKETEFVTALPPHDIATHGISFIKGLGAYTSHILRKEGRMGTYFLENGTSLRPSKVIYDRTESVFCNTKFEEYAWDAILCNTNILYLSGITPCLCDNLFDCTLKLCKIAKEKGIKIFYDVNFRSALCEPQKAAEILLTLAPFIDTLICNEEHLKALLKINSDFGEKNTKERLFELTKKAIEITKIKNLAITVRRTHSASDATVYASLFLNNEFAISKPYSVHITDRVGSGDAFSAGLIYALQQGFSVYNTVDFATASNAIKHTVLNDINFAHTEEILNLTKNNFDVKR